MIYLDHNATTPIDPRVQAAMQPYLERFYGNPSALYRWGRLVRDAVEQARAQVAALVGANPNQVIFTSGGTEANNLALQGYCRAHPESALLVSPVEHPSVLETVVGLARQGVACVRLEVDGEGRVVADALAEQLERHPHALVSCMLANNETGVIQPLTDLVTAARRYPQVRFHTDAVQAAGRLALDFPRLGVQMLSLSSHKLYGPKGVGALVLDRSLTLEPLLYGGGQEQGLRGGTENVIGIVGFGAAAELARTEREARETHLLNLRRRLEAGLARLPGVTIFAARARRLANTVQFGVAGIDGEMLVMALDRRRIAVSSGSACASGGGEPSHVLLAMGVDADLAKSAVRVSLGKDNTEADVEAFLTALRQVLEELKPN
ncbi:cysteine desulfurase [Methylomarinovum tepidoasis]|uniref:Cysteine desulfurase n=1 Tax=Methylomarinovum tepidoasis TaxID=2840183 RepID=A0AAU9CCA0_9GAMM|nr:cysteine desulfurase family protein [Methylomarinovum sp. IN45]BCX89561.1 cysteine desulfurase [Methylomarinovum sp. IN45]